MLTMPPPPRSTIDGSAARQVWKAAVRSVRDHRVPLGRLDLEERPDLGPPGVVDEAVDAPEAIDDGGDEALGLVAVGEVGGEASRRRRRPRARARASLGPVRRPW